jgi:hypothetical protein
MPQAVARSAGLPENRQAAGHMAVAVVVASAAAAVVAASVTARRVRCTPRPVRAAGVRHKCLSSPAKIAQFTVVIVTSPSRAMADSALGLLANHAGSHYDTDYCKSQRLV